MAWISVSECRRLMDNAISVQVIYNLVHDGQVKSTKIRAKILVDKDDWERIVREGGFAVIRASKRSEQGQAPRVPRRPRKAAG